MSTQVEYNGNFNDFFISFVKGYGKKILKNLYGNKISKLILIVPYGPWLKHVEEYLSTPNVHIIAYEDLHSVKINLFTILLCSIKHIFLETV
jgi:hypothetical protein